MSTAWINAADADELIGLSIEMSCYIDGVADDLEASTGGAVGAIVERDMVARWEALYQRIDTRGTYPAACNGDPGYWVFTRQQLDCLAARLDQYAAAILVQALDSPAARQLGIHILPEERPA